MSDQQPSAIHKQRREQYMQAMGDNAVAVICSPAEATRNGDVHHPFRQSSDLFYLTGFAEQQTTLVLRPGAEKDRFVLFVRPRDPERETWDGRRAGIKGAMDRYGADAAYSVDELDDRLIKLVANHDDLYYSVGLDEAVDAQMMAMIAQLRMHARRGKRPPKRIVDPAEVLHEMRLLKSPDEIAIMRKAADITVDAHIEAMKAAREGVGEHELEALVNYTFRKNGGSGPGYNTIVGSADNATILHYIENDRVAHDGELVLIDAGCEYEHYTADVTRTFPVSGSFTDAQRGVYEAVLAAQIAGIEMTKPGVTIDDIHERTVELLTQGLVDLGLLEGPAAERIEDESYKRYYMHRTSHWLGMDVHDVGAYTNGDTPRPLEPGMVITIEPGLYIAADCEEAPEEFRGIGIRIEDDILVTDGGYEVLTSGAPKTVSDVERICQSGL